MNEKDLNITKWLDIIEKIHIQAPEYGKINIELIFHQNGLSKVIITEKMDTVIFDKSERKLK